MPLTTSLTKGKLSVCETWPCRNPALNSFDTYKYLGVFELDQFKEKRMHEIVLSYRRRIHKLLKSALNGHNLILAINMWALPLIHYTAGVIKWSLCELKQLDISTRKLLVLMF